MTDFILNTFHLTTTDHIEQGRSFAIVQGASFDSVAWWYPADVSAWIPRGQIRTNYAQAGGILKAAFSFDPLVYVQRPGLPTPTLQTKIRPILTATQTENLFFDLPLRKTPQHAAIPGVNVWVYDLELVHPTNPDTVIRIAKGFVEVDLEVTRS